VTITMNNAPTIIFVTFFMTFFFMTFFSLICTLSATQNESISDYASLISYLSDI